MGVTILLITAFILFFLAAVAPLIADKANPVFLGWLGMFFFVLMFVINK